MLGSMLMDQDVIPEVEEILKPEDFYAKQHQMLYGAIVELYEAGKTVDVVSLKELLSQKKDVPEELGSVEFFARTVRSGSYRCECQAACTDC